MVQNNARHRVISMKALTLLVLLKPLQSSLFKITVLLFQFLVKNKQPQ